MRELLCGELKEISGGYFSRWGEMYKILTTDNGSNGGTQSPGDSTESPSGDHINVAPGRDSAAYGYGWGEDNNGLG